MKHVVIFCFLFVRTAAVAVDANIIESVFLEAGSVVIDKAFEYAEETKKKKKKKKKKKRREKTLNLVIKRKFVEKYGEYTPYY